jgi:hypothetical protein
MQSLDEGRRRKSMGASAGLKVLMDDGKVFECYESMQDTIRYSEIGSSRAILQAGYNLDSFMARFSHIPLG